MDSNITAIREDTLAALRGVLPADVDTVGLLDHPNHFNAGDLLIYQGELAYLERLGIAAAYVCTTFSYDRSVLAQRMGVGPLLLHGGGNFGDRYPKYQRLRERAIEQHSHRKIVQLPQTIEFKEGAALDRAQRIYSQHPDLTLMMRDKSGFAHARELFPQNNVVYCPDMAFGAGSLRATAAPKDDIVLLKRKDGESIYSDNELPDILRAAYRTDWHVSTSGNLKWWPVTVVNQLVHHAPSVRNLVYPMARWAFDWQGAIIVDNAVRILSRGKVVVTDRLHAAIYSMLMGKNVVMVDNANRKISNIYRDYLGGSPLTHLAGDFNEAGEVAKSLL
jgi:exopolysaccharide biosynthesis predicted pyruvyltransferase EpsI